MKYEITDQIIYKTVHFTIEADNGEVYRANVTENDLYDEWIIMDEDGNEIDDNPELYDTLVALCKESISK